MFIFFSMIFILLFSYKSFSITSKHFLQVLIITICFYLNTLDYFFSNKYNFNTDFLLFNYNILLNNSINKIHPLFLYGSIFYLFYNVYLLKCNDKLLHLNFNFLKLVYTLPTCFKYLFFTLFLGSWWAFQEGSWGGWWDWDISEVFGLYILINITKSFHNIYINRTNNFSSLMITSYFFSLLIFYFFMQLNFSLISHNFNLNTSSNFISNLLYLLFIIILLLLLFIIFFKLTHLTNVKSLTFTPFYALKNNWIFKIQLIIFFNFLVFFSLFPILSNWLWTNFSIEYSFTNINFHNMLVSLFLFLLTSYWFLDFLMLFLLFIFIYCNVSLIVILTMITTFNSQQLLHYFMFWFLIVISFLSPTESSYWLQIHYGFNYFFHFFYNSLKSDSPFLSVCRIILDLNFYKCNNFNWWYDFSSLDFKTFILKISNNNFFQIFIHDVEQNIFVTSISSTTENSILNIILLTVLIFFLKKNKVLIIIF